MGEYQKRELQPALELLQKAGLVYPVVRSAGQVIPIFDANDAVREALMSLVGLP